MADLPGIRRTPASWQVFAKVRGEFRSKCFPLDTGTLELKRQRDLLKTESYYGRLLDAAHGPGFAAEAKSYKALVTGMPSYRDRAYEVDAWARAFGDRPRATITGRDIRAVLERWRLDGRADGTGGLSLSSLNRRRTSLMALWTALDGRSAANPVKDVPPYTEHQNEQVRAQDPRILYRLIARVGRRRPPSKTRARLRLMLWTGWPQKQVMALRPADIDWTPGREAARVSGRRKGKGSPPRTVPLLPGAVRALRAFEAAEAWGPFSTSAMHSSMARAVAEENAWRARLSKPPIAPVRPYDLRHTFGSELAKRLTDERAIQEFMLHRTPQQTRRYTESATAERLERARRELVGTPDLHQPRAAKVAYSPVRVARSQKHSVKRRK